MIRERRDQQRQQIERSPDLRFVMMRIFNEYDPIGIVCEANPGEYAHEVDRTIEKLPRASSWQDVFEILAEEFNGAFLPNVARVAERRDKYEGLARAVRRAWVANRTE